MKLYPYLNFNGNCADAIEFYEAVFNAKALTLRYKDVAGYDSSYKIEKGTEDFVMHSNLNLPDGEMIQFCDMPKDVWYGGGNQVTLGITLKTEEEVKNIFSKLSVGGQIFTSPQRTFWSASFCSLKDKFGVYWILMQAPESK